MKWLFTLVALIYTFGTSTLFHAFAMDHVYSHDTHEHHNIVYEWLSHQKDSSKNNIWNCGDDNQCMQVCWLVESSRITLIPSSYTFTTLLICQYATLSPFLPSRIITLLNNNFTKSVIQKPPLSLTLVWVIKLTI